MSMTFTLTDAQVDQFMDLSRASVEAHVEAAIEPVSPTICFEYSVMEATWVAEVRCGNRIEELGAVEGVMVISGVWKQADEVAYPAG